MMHRKFLALLALLLTLRCPCPRWLRKDLPPFKIRRTRSPVRFPMFRPAAGMQPACRPFPAAGS